MKTLIDKPEQKYSEEYYGDNYGTDVSANCLEHPGNQVSEIFAAKNQDHQRTYNRSPYHFQALLVGAPSYFKAACIVNSVA